MLIISMYVTMVPLILGGIANMIFTKTRIYKKNKYPIDFNIRLKDGNRLFGENKTFIGFISMIVFVMLFQNLWGALCNITKIERLNDWYLIYQNNITINTITGFIIGLVYMVSELPNSFIKRRISIPSGKTVNGFKGKIFLIIDQIDSLIGVFIVLKIVSGISVMKTLLYILIGGLTHIIINITLHKLKIRKNI